MSRVTHRTMQVGPDQASKWLEVNISNRTVRPSRVKQYAEAMSHGQWLYTADPIRFDEDGRLIDGQHRLMAVVRSEATVEMQVVRGLSREAQDAVDTGAARTASDALKVRGFKHTAQLAATVPLVNWLLEGAGWAASYPRDDVVYWAGVHDGLAEIVDQAAKNQAMLPCPLPPYAAAYYAATYKAADPAATDEFFVDQLVDTIGLAKGAPALATRRYLLAQREASGERGKAAKAGQALALLDGYAHFRADKRLFTMRTPRGGWPVDDPVVIPN